MTPEHSLEYLLPASEVTGECCEHALSRIHLEPGGTHSSDITFMDTFDGRLYRRGKVFRVERSPGGRTDWVLHDFREQGSDFRVPGTSGSLPCFAWDVADERLRGELRSLIDVRTLLPQAQARRVRQRLNVIDDRELAGAALYLDHYRLVEKSKPLRSVGTRLVIERAGPPNKRARKAVEQWAESRGLERPEHDVWLDILLLTHRPSGPGFEIVPADLRPDLRADHAVKRILLMLFGVMRANEPGLLANLDTEFLHDFRVAVRRSRSVLGQLRCVFPDRAIAAFRRELCWLGTMTGPVRDLDVYLLEFPQLEASLPEFMHGDLAPLKSLLEHRAKAARRALVRSLGSRRYRHFTERWRLFLNRPVPRCPSSPKALEPISKVAGTRIWKLYRRVTEGECPIDEHTSGEAIHDLRKRCKKIRYLTEFVEPLHARDAFRKPIKDLKALQNHLGAFQDAEVQIAHLREWSAELAADRAVPAATLIAVGALIGFFDQRQRERRGRIAEAVAEFGKKDNRERFRHLLDEPE